MTQLTHSPGTSLDPRQFGLDPLEHVGGPEYPQGQGTRSANRLLPLRFGTNHIRKFARELDDRFSRVVVPCALNPHAVSRETLTLTNTHTLTHTHTPGRAACTPTHTEIDNYSPPLIIPDSPAARTNLNILVTQRKGLNAPLYTGPPNRRPPTCTSGAHPPRRAGLQRRCA